MSTWVAAHVFHHGNHDRLLVDAVRPLAARLCGDGTASGVFFLRYWDGGPHVRVRFRTADATVPTLTEAVETHLVDHLRRHPAPTTVDRTTYVRHARELARWEGLDEPSPLYPNNCVRFLPYRPEVERYGTGRSLAAVEDHFVESSVAVLRNLRALGPDARAHAVAGMLVGAWRVAAARGIRLWDSQRRESEVVGGWFSPGELQQFRLEHRDVFRRLWERTTDDAANHGGLVPTWIRSIRRLDERLWEAGHPDPGRVLDLCVHMTANRLGLPIHQEQAIRIAAAAAINEVASDVDTREVHV